MLYTWLRKQVARKSCRTGRSPGQHGRTLRPMLEGLESRTLLSTVPVTSATALIARPQDAGVAPVPVDHLSVALSQTSAVAGQAVNVTVTALDAGGSLVSSYAGTVHFTSSDTAAGLPADYTFMPGDNGVHTFSVTFNTAGNQTVTATDTTVGTVQGTGGLQVVNPLPAVTGLGQTSAAEGSGDLVLTVNGSNFVSSSVVQWNGQPLATTLVNGGQLQATVPAADLAEGGTATLTVVSPGPGGGTSAGQTFTVVDGAVTVTATPVSATENTPFSGPVATFSDAGGLDAANSYAVTVDWGDGTAPTAGTVSAGPGNTFQVNGQHTYAENGSYTVKVSVLDDGVSTTGTATATVAESPINLTVGAIKTTEGTLFNGQVASFTDANGAEGAAAYHALIDWGDGTAPTAGTISAGPNGSFQVNSQHTYAEDGSFTVKVEVQEADVGSGTAALNSAKATVADAALGGTADTLKTTEGSALGGVVASFTDPGALPGSTTKYQVSINWGDGSAPDTNVQLTPAPGHGKYNITGHHTYANAGNYKITIQVLDPGGSKLTLTGGAQVADAPLRIVGQTINVTQGLTVSKAAVAIFGDTAPLGPAGNYTATINWGDGTAPTTGTLVSSGNHTFTVLGSHTYAEPGKFTVQVTVRDKGGSSILVKDPANVGTAAARFVDKLYHDLLGRPVDPASLKTWTNLMNKGVSRKQVALDIENTTAYRTRLIDQLYETFLHWMPDSAGLKAWLQFLAHGGTDEQLAAQILGSAEYFQSRAGKTVAGFLGALYHDVFGKTIDPGTQAVFTAELSKGASRSTIALQVETSNQAEQARVQGYFKEFLHKAGTTAQVAKYVQWLQQGKHDEDVIADLVSSSAYAA